MASNQDPTPSNGAANYDAPKGGFSSNPKVIFASADPGQWLSTLVLSLVSMTSLNHSHLQDQHHAGDALIMTACYTAGP